MNDWTAPSNPHADHPQFRLDLKARNPAKNGKWKKAEKPPTVQTFGPVPASSSSKKRFEAMCAKLLHLVSTFNKATGKCKLAATGTVEEIAKANEAYDVAVAELNDFMGRPSGNPNPGYQQFLKPE
jgi:hypothetical protein